MAPEIELTATDLYREKRSINHDRWTPSTWSASVKILRIQGRNIVYERTVKEPK